MSVGELQYPMNDILLALGLGAAFGLILVVMLVVAGFILKRDYSK